MNNTEIITQINKELNILYLCMAQMIVILIIDIVIKKKILTEKNHINKSIIGSIWRYNALPLFLYTYLLYKQNFLTTIFMVIIALTVIAYNAYQFSKIEKKYGLLALILSLNFLMFGIFILILNH